ncbi:adenylate/guanylate cyclase domain-containing protein [Emcibacter nanhaiensis]|uniref:Guanylate cyclase domain-containing protein n=1 Tax=Emcibacter nanhaiensis TaxID=1505037 RepID=A0A501PFX6_9PROT|nr:adenylate/guanylate cyclase domain-containing protein [Emcibacter nanhaiensis]TPD59333.1 hypothetical protein FIV46_11090 [Emcibacter nanhaiensis]
MPWNQDTALARIKKLKSEVPDFDVRQFQEYWQLYKAEQAARSMQKQPATPPLFSLPKNRAIVVDTVQVYIAITNYDDYRLEDGRETESSHKRALQLLHLYYSAADRAIEASSAQRVDFHNGRVHAVVLERGNKGITADTISEAFAFIEDFKRLAAAANRELAGSEFNVTFRIGVDVGTCVAINNGTGCEQEPMFLGSAANHAAKLASGQEPGVYVSDRVRNIVGFQSVGVLSEIMGLSDHDISLNSARRMENDQLVYGVQDRSAYVQQVMGNWQQEIKRGEFPDYTNPNFSFYYKEPPLSKINYSELQPSRSIRMPVVSIFADLSGYTAYIDNAVSTGSIREAVTALYVIRQEFQNVVEKDFGGRKVRFIGDCIHAVVAEGTSTETKERESVATAALCAGGLQSSFRLCKEVLGNLNSLGLAIGIELGPTPISRIGIRGERSVRVASSIATTLSEKMQKECEENGVKFGINALRAAPAALEDLLNNAGYSAEMDYGEVAICLSATPSAIASGPAVARAHAPVNVPQPRAHFKSE